MKILAKIILIIFISLNILEAFAQSSTQNVKVFSSPDKAVAASAQSGSNAIQVLNSSGLGFASAVNLSWVAVALGLAVASVWDGSDGEQQSSSSTTSN